MVSLGVDYGTGSWKVARLGEAAAELSRFADGEAAWTFLTEADRRWPGLAIVLPSGFGIPAKRVQDVADQDLFEMTLRKGPPSQKGLGQFLEAARQSALNAFCIPAVKLLPTIPVHRKVNKIDMGTSDKLCAAAWVIARLAEAGQPLEAIRFCLLELGEGFKALLAIRGGRIIDGIGGTAGGIGPRARGAIDGEWAYLQAWESKAAIYSGGALDIEARFGGHGMDALWEAVEKELFMFLHYHDLPEVIVVGRRKEAALERLHSRFPARALLREGEGFEAALGAAILANGLAGGDAALLVKHLGLLETRDRVLDWLCL